MLNIVVIASGLSFSSFLVFCGFSCFVGITNTGASIGFDPVGTTKKGFFSPVFVDVIGSVIDVKAVLPVPIPAVLRVAGRTDFAKAAVVGWFACNVLLTEDESISLIGVRSKVPTTGTSDVRVDG